MQQATFLNMVLPFKDKIFRLAKRLLTSNEEAEDATQEVFEKLWKKKALLDQFDNLEAFAMRITKNYCLDQLKSKNANHSRELLTDFEDKTTGLHQQIEAKDSLRWVEIAINQLPKKQKIVLQLRDIEEYEFEKIAEITKMNPIAIRVSLSRARNTIKEYMIKKHQYGLE